MGTSYTVIKLKNWPGTVAPFTRSAMAAAQFDHHVTCSYSMVHCMASTDQKGYLLSLDTPQFARIR